jgi:hypothetical protein
MKLELSNITPYLPYNLKCEYIGIINGKDLSEQDKAFKKDGMPFDFNIEPITGIKHGELKEILIFKNYWRAYIGNKGRALKSFHNGFDFKPVLRPMNDIFKWMPDTEISFYSFAKHEFNVDLDSDFSFEFETYHASIYRIDLHRILSAINFLFEHHFDVFGLIEQGLAIDLNTLKND